MDLIIIEAPGKKQIWTKLLGQCGIHAEVMATAGLVARYPDVLEPLGIVFRPRSGRQPAVLECLRQDDDMVRDMLLSTVSRLRNGLSAIHLASDADDQGDVIAWDIARILCSSDTSLTPLIRRTLPRSMTVAGVSAAISNAKPLNPLHLATAAIPGRARTIFDRLAGASLSRPGMPAGRVRNAVLGGILMLSDGRIGRERLETGEILFRVRSASGNGQPAIARIGCHGTPKPVLLDIAREFSGGLVPGLARPFAAAGAMPVTRIGRPLACGTAEALIIAARHYGLRPGAAMAGLQKAYIDGLVSYPRVESGQAAAHADIRRIAESLSISIHLPTDSTLETDPRHEPLHPVVSSENGEGDIGWWRYTLAMPDNLVPAMDPANGVRDRMASIVARRSIEAFIPSRLISCSWDDDGEDLTREWRNILAELDWQIEDGPRPTWPRALSTGARQWPPASQLIEFMAAAHLGRPSTIADHAENLLASGEIEFGPWVLPSLTPAGAASVDGPAAGLSAPSISRKLEEIVCQSRNSAMETLAANGKLDISEWIGNATLNMLASLDTETRGSMLRFAGINENFDLLTPILPPSALPTETVPKPPPINSPIDHDDTEKIEPDLDIQNVDEPSPFRTNGSGLDIE